jgi:putative hydrolase of the HAD superfamily
MNHSHPRALVFDVDGTLYRQRRLRCHIAYRFARSLALSPAEGVQAWRAIRAYRRAQETLRTQSEPCADVARAQLRLAAQNAGMPVEQVERWVVRWMEREPLSLLSACVMEDLHETLTQARRRGLRLGVFSDYPAVEKLRALGVLDLFDSIVSAQDPEVQRFKPHPRGIEVTLKRLCVAKEQAVYVGDRADVDVEAAGRAGMRCVIVRRSFSRDLNEGLEGFLTDGQP